LCWRAHCVYIITFWFLGAFFCKFLRKRDQSCRKVVVKRLKF
jgi:hypothetical protein